MEIALNTQTNEAILENLKKSNVIEDYKKDCKEMTLKVSKKLGKGEVYFLEFQEGISLYIYTVQLKEQVILKYLPNKYQPIRFFYCLKGSSAHSIQSEDIQYRLADFEGSISACSHTCEQKLKFPANERIELCMLEINREKYLSKIACDLEKVPQRLKNAMTDIKGEKSFFYQSDYSYHISNCINEIRESSYDGLVRSAFLEAKIHEIFFLQVKQYYDDLISSGTNAIIRENDLKKIHLAKEIIHSDLKNAPTIKELAKKVGTNEFKLKKAFKEVFNSTIYNYIRDKRLEKARLLLIENSMSIGEISEAIGYKNSGHFSKRFKEKYGMLPKKYHTNFRNDIEKQEPKTLADV